MKASNDSLTLSPAGTRMSHSQSKLCWYVSHKGSEGDKGSDGAQGDLNLVPGLVSNPPQLGIPLEIITK